MKNFVKDESDYVLDQVQMMVVFKNFVDNEIDHLGVCF